MQTQALTSAVTEVKPLQTGAATGAVQTHNAAASPLRDPNNPLSKRRLQYDYDSAAIKEEYGAILEAHAKYLKGNKAANVILQGHADERGSREYNLALGQRRSEGVSKALQLLGVPDAQVEAVSLGEEKPLAEGNEEAAWRQNRRVEILYQGE
ncbi:MAG: peptidoglycan-associated lipoprotein Pal [Betaproteobacteria bacterium]|nr:peptidoglycan-associated lipoprotein Pal [Betaproteobacteria bacterium]